MIQLQLQWSETVLDCIKNKKILNYKFVCVKLQQIARLHLPARINPNYRFTFLCGNLTKNMSKKIEIL